MIKYITRKLHESRFKSKLYCFNIFFVLGNYFPFRCKEGADRQSIALYCVVITLNVVYQYSYVSSKGVCIIGVNPQSLIVFIILDSALNLYLTILFVIPLRGESPSYLSFETCETNLLGFKSAQICLSENTLPFTLM
jgi:hypothetical protein